MMESLCDQNNLLFTIMILDPEKIYFHVVGMKISLVPGET